MSSTKFAETVRLARECLPEVVHNMMEIVRGTATYVESKNVSGTIEEITMEPKPMERIAASKVIKDIVLNKDAVGISDDDDSLAFVSPSEKKRLAEELLQEAEDELMRLQ